MLVFIVECVHCVGNKKMGKKRAQLILAVSFFFSYPIRMQRKKYTHQGQEEREDDEKTALFHN